MRTRLLALMLLLPGAVAVHATHNRAGEIIVCHVGGYTYEATIITHCKLSAPADRPELTLFWGDGTSQSVARQAPQDFPQQDLRRNVYIATHQYSGPGEFILSFDDQNRNAGVVNIPGSVDQSFCVKTKLVISPLAGNNCSPRFLNSPIQDACFCRPWIHNPAAYDPDGDSLSYEPVVCLGLNCQPIAGYQYPNEVGGCNGASYSIDPVNGTIRWLNPGLLGEYNLAFRVYEWRRVNGVLVNMGWVTRDMQVTVRTCANQPPVIGQVRDTCVTAGTFLTFNVPASDPDPGQAVTLTALGQPFVMPSSPATFVSPSPAQSVNGVFSWNTNCSHVRLQPYQVVFDARDNDNEVELHDYRTVNITVVSPPPLNPTATPSGASIALDWDPSICTNAIGYRIYRRLGAYGFGPDNCETGVPAYTGYTLLATVQGSGTTSYTDNGPLVIGNQYCYMVVAFFADGAESYASVEFCATLDRQVPVMTHVSVGATSSAAGVDTVRWSNAFDLDTLARPGPYQFKLYRGTGLATAGTLIHTSALHPFLAHPDTEYIDTGLDTEGQAHVYRVELFGAGGNDFIGSASPASSVFLAAAPNDEQLTISWSLDVPWTNSLYEVYRNVAGSWSLVGTSTSGSFTEAGLSNGTTYCYRVRSIGAYSEPGIASPLLNYSQEICAAPRDLTPPCAPLVVLDNDCEEPLNTLTWNDPNQSCADDTYQYRVYFAETAASPYQLIATIVGAGNTSFTHVNGSSVAGCYQVTAIDTVGNESAFIEPVCGDNCPVYALPNIFTPNGDRVNDLFVPFPYRGVKAIDLRVFNRWGQVVFTTTDPDVRWNGTLNNEGETCPDGVYYYTCTVTYARLAGDEPAQLNGYVHISGSGPAPRTN
ncbi:MAG: gliding motility-associated C-terminal domain-containing protein [Flavobacteriales bacterium]|nr:MAG: gliding motility-associated C-terminal domain-containing protein [Flavobacteriales bacterium]